MASGGLAVAVGLLVLIGWYFRLPDLASIHPVLGTMAKQAAFCFSLAGGSLLLLSLEQPHRALRRTAHAAAVVVIVIAVVTVSMSAIGPTLDAIDARMFGGAIGSTLSGRMPVPSALAFASIGFALLAIDVNGRRVAPAEVLALGATLIALLALVAYAYGSVLAFGVTRLRPLAFHSVALFLVVPFGILMARPRRGLMRLATSRAGTGVMVRRLFPAAIGIPVLLGVLVVAGQRAGLFPAGLSLAYYSLSIIVVFSVLIFRTAILLDRADRLTHRAEDELRTLNTELEARVAARTTELQTVVAELEAFSYSVSHDLRAPLRHITGFAELLSQDAGPRLDAQGRKYIATIVGAAQRMAQLIDSLLSFSRMSRSTFAARRVKLAELVAQARQEVMAQANAGDRRIEWRIGPLPDVDGDPAMLRQVFINLLSNAVKYTGRCPEAVIEVGTVPGPPHEVVVFVRDNGAGFDMQYADKLFGVFQRLHRAGEFDGTGIGLANVKRIVTRHGGRVWADARVDEGATFFVSLPLQGAQ